MKKNVLWNLKTDYTGCPRRKGPNFGRVFLRSNYTDITQLWFDGYGDIGQRILKL